MEFFERAHVIKKRHIKNKINKSEETIKKKQLKQMLHGYKSNNSQLIKSCSSKVIDLADCYSNSSYSEPEYLDTNTGENVTLNKSYNIEEHDLSYQEDSISNSSMSNPLSLTPRSFVFSDEDKSKSDITESISECNDIKTLSENLSLGVDQNFPSDISEAGSFSNENSSSSLIMSEESEPFDADGTLASKILSEIKKVKNTEAGKNCEAIPKMNKKSKSTNVFKEVKGEVRAPKRTNKLNIEDETAELTSTFMDELEYLNISDGDRTPSLDDDVYSLDSEDEIDVTSSPFESIAASDIPTTSLRDVLGDYKHSTVKNMPSLETQMHPHSSTLFTSPYLTGNEVQVEECSITDLDNETSFELENFGSIEAEDIRGQCDESMDYVDDGEQSEVAIDRELSTDSQDTTITTSVRIFRCKNAYILVLPHPSEIYIHGKVSVTALSGEIEVLGYSLKDKTYEMYAPTNSFALCLRTIQNENACYGLFGKLTGSGLSVAEAEDIVTSIGEFDGLIKLQTLKSLKIDFVDNNFNVTDLFSKINKNVDECFKKASQELACSVYLTRPWKCFEEHSSWEQALKYGLKKQSRGIICGGKDTGKSTFLRYYVNKLLAQGPVLVIDLDPGQSEFTVSGNVSATIVTKPLLGPSFTHLMKPDKTLHIGMINVMDNLRRYINAVSDLMEYCLHTEQYQNIPWIVNTMGMCNTVGLKLVSLFIIMIKPTFLQQMDSKNAKRRFECFLNPHTIKGLYAKQYVNDVLFKRVTCPEHFDYAFLVSVGNIDGVKSGYSLSARDQRYLNVLAYFGELLERHNGKDLLGITPYQVNLKDLNIGINVKIVQETVNKVINGKIVALCQHEAQDKAGQVFTLGDKPLLCHGLGLVRGIDYEKGNLYVLTPAPIESLDLVNTIVYSDWVPELRGTEKHLPEGTAVPYRTTTLHKQKQLMFVPRRRFNPISLLKMSRT